MCKSHLTTNARNERLDPTRTTTIRRKWEADLVRRFKRLRRLIAQKIIEEDAFGLREKPNPLVFNRGQFEFTRTQDKVGGFMDWLSAEQSATILGVRPGTPMSKAADQSWQNIYIDSSYRRGVENAASLTNRAEVASLGTAAPERGTAFIEAAFTRPIHADAVGMIYTRAYSDLAGITAEMDKQISRILAQGLVDGVSPRELAKQIAGRIDKVGITRARMLARTEVVKAQTDASLNTYAEAGVEGVNVMAEFLTADGNACEECQALEGNPYTLDDARGIIPVHPNCRCTFIPAVEA